MCCCVFFWVGLFVDFLGVFGAWWLCSSAFFLYCCLPVSGRLVGWFFGVFGWGLVFAGFFCSVDLRFFCFFWCALFCLLFSQSFLLLPWNCVGCLGARAEGPFLAILSLIVSIRFSVLWFVCWGCFLMCFVLRVSSFSCSLPCADFVLSCRLLVIFCWLLLMGFPLVICSLFLRLGRRCALLWLICFSCSLSPLT
ncbi:hypothetical protein SK79_01209 [Escherichia coli]|nr:hypothetical protein SK79_01209 [Escherichia coli]